MIVPMHSTWLELGCLFLFLLCGYPQLCFEGEVDSMESPRRTEKQKESDLKSTQQWKVAGLGERGCKMVLVLLIGTSVYPFLVCMVPSWCSADLGYWIFVR